MPGERAEPDTAGVPATPMSPRMEIPAGACYDVDALLGELVPDDAPPPGLALCQSVEDLYSGPSRFALGDALAEFLDGRRLTPTELLHMVEPQRQYMSWYGRAVALERAAQTQAVPGRVSALQRLETLRRLEQEAVALTEQRVGHGVPRPLDAGRFAALLAEHAPGRSAAGRYAVDAALAAWLADCGSFEAKAMRLLSLAGDAVPAEGREILDQVIGEVVASPLAAQELFGWAGPLRAMIEAMAQVWRGEAAGGPLTPPVVGRLAAHCAARPAPAAVRLGLEIAIQRALAGEQRLAATPVLDPRATSVVLDEVQATRALAGVLTGEAGTIGGTRTQAVLDARIARMLTEERLDAMMSSRSHHARVVDLLTIEEAVFGETSRHRVRSAAQKLLDQRDFTQRLFDGVRTPRARIKALGDLQRRVARSGLAEAGGGRYLRMLDEMQHTYLRTSRVLARIAREAAPAPEDVMEFAALCAEGAFTEGKCIAAVRDLIAHHVRSTSFLRRFLAGRKASPDGQVEGIGRLLDTLTAAGTPLRDMATVGVLLADDEPAARTYVEMILRDLGVSRIFTADDGLEATATLDENGAAIDLVICDWKMPRQSGLDVLKRVRATRPDLPFLMVTALATMIAVEEAVAHDVTAYIAKPFTPEQLEEKVLVLVNR